MPRRLRHPVRKTTSRPPPPRSSVDNSNSPRQSSPEVLRKTSNRAEKSLQRDAERAVSTTIPSLFCFLLFLLASFRVMLEKLSFCMVSSSLSHANPRDANFLFVQTVLPPWDREFRSLESRFQRFYFVSLSVEGTGSRPLRYRFNPGIR